MFTVRRDGALQNHRLGIPCDVPKQVHGAKYLQGLNFLATLERIRIEKYGKLFVCFDGHNIDKVRRRHARKCMAEERIAESADIGNAGVR